MIEVPCQRVVCFHRLHLTLDRNNNRLFRNRNKEKEKINRRELKIQHRITRTKFLKTEMLKWKSEMRWLCMPHSFSHSILLPNAYTFDNKAVSPFSTSSIYQMKYSGYKSDSLVLGINPFLPTSDKNHIGVALPLFTHILANRILDVWIAKSNRNEKA